MISIISISNLYKERPSKVLGIVNCDYTAFCFDEACSYIMMKIESGEEPTFKKDKKEKKIKKYKSFKDMYDSYTS